MTWVALLRGINVGGRNSLPMKDLAKMFEDEGCAKVSTFIQSGNVVFDAPKKLGGQIPARIAQRIQKRFALKVPVMVRTAEELAAVPGRNPFPDADPDQLHVMFLREAGKGTLDPKRSPGDEFALVGRDVYLRLPNGVGRSKLTNAYFDRALDTISTGRNWRTVMKLIALSSQDRQPWFL